MNKKRLLLVFLVLALLVAMPSSAAACKRIYRAKLVSLPGVSGTHTGTFLMRYWLPGQILVDVTSQNLSGTPTRVELDVDGTPLGLCGAPAPAMEAVCPPLSGTGAFSLSGQITPALLMGAGINNADLLDALDAGLVSIRVDTVANPTGEAGGPVVLDRIICGQVTPP